jgi:hypothetical protein
MTRLSPADIEWLLQRRADEPGIWLMTVDGPELDGARYFALNKVPVTSRGTVFEPGGFDFSEPGDNEEIPEARISVPNIDRAIGHALQEARSGLTFSFELVRENDPDRVVMSWRQLELRNAKIDHLAVTGNLSAANYQDEPYKPLKISQSKFPGLYA